MKDSGRRWLVAAVGLFLFLLVGWVLLALQLNSALAGPLPFGPGLMSKLSADYRADEGGRSVILVSLSIMNEALNDAMQTLGLTEEEAAAAHESMELAMSQPVPTATAMDFDGAAPFTATPTITNTPLPTKTATPTPTNTRRPPTQTPKPTKTLAPTSRATVVDDITPVIDMTGVAWGPTPLPVDVDLPGCSVTFTMSNVHVTDPAPSSGIAYVGFKYRVLPYLDFTLGPPFGPSGPDSYSGNLPITISPTWLVTPMPNPGPDFHLELWVKAYDAQGNSYVVPLGDYYIDDHCDDGPTPTATPSRTPTPIPSATPTSSLTPIPTI